MKKQQQELMKQKEYEQEMFAKSQRDAENFRLLETQRMKEKTLKEA